MRFYGKTLFIISLSMVITSCSSKTTTTTRDTGTTRDKGVTKSDARSTADLKSDAKSVTSDAKTTADAKIPPTVNGMMAAACTAGKCLANSAVNYWKGDWTTYAIKRKLTMKEAGNSYSFTVTDDKGVAATLEFQIGVPVTLEIVNPGNGDTTGSHFFSSPKFFRAVAWRKVETSSNEFKSPLFDSFLLKKTSGTDRSFRLYFIPMVAGSYDAYCEHGVTDSEKYADIAEGKVTPTLSTGDAGKGMKVTVAITGTLGGTFDPQLTAGRDPALDRDARRRATDAVWANGSRDETNLNNPLVIIENSKTSFAFAPSNTNFTANKGAIWRIQNKATNLGKHYVTMPEFFAASILRMASDVDIEAYAPYLTAAEAYQGKEFDLYVVPTKAGTFKTYCEIGVTASNGVPNLDSGHAGLGMTGTVTVQ